MTDTELVHQVEQALLGAMITRPRRIDGLPGDVTPDLFTDERHQAIAAALTGTAGEAHGLLGRLRGFLARFSKRARETSAYMDTLPDLCPDAGHIGSYYGILDEARALRTAAGRVAAQQASRGTQVLDGAGYQLAVQTDGAAPVARDPGELSPSVARLARALNGRRRQPAQPSVPQPETQAQPPAAQPLAARGPETPVRATEQPDKAAPHTARITRPEDFQDLVLAALMRHGDEARDVTQWLPPEAFKEGERRELFTMIEEHVRQRREVDPLIMAWAADLNASAGPSGESWGRGEGWVSPEFVLGVGDLGTGPGTATVLGRMLLAEHIVNSEPAANGRHHAQDAATVVTSTMEPAAGRGPEVAHDAAQRQEPAPAQRRPGAPAQANARGARAGSGEPGRSVREKGRAAGTAAPAPLPLRPPTLAPDHAGPSPRRW